MATPYANRGCKIGRKAADIRSRRVGVRSPTVASRILDTSRFPSIDVVRGGSIQGEIDGLNHILDLSVRPLPFFHQGGGTTIVPANGHIYDYIDLVDYRDMVVVIRDTVADMFHRGMTLVQIKAAHPAKAYDGRYGSADDFVEAIYKGLQ